jgi:molecular chaperone GrpE
MSESSEEKNGVAGGDQDNPGSAEPADAVKGEGESSSSEPPDPIAEAKAEAARMKEQWIRTAADFDNFRKRTRRELEDARKSGREEILKEFLPVFDNLERAIHSAQRAQEVKAVADGLQMILRQYGDTLGRVGIQKVKTIGQQFDPSHHEAIQQIETDEHPPGTVVAEVQPGYLQGERLIRAAMVVVAKPKAKPDAENDGKDDNEGGKKEEPEKAD